MRRMLVVLLAGSIFACASREILPPWDDLDHEAELVRTESERAQAEPITILPKPEGLDPRLVELGGRLFFDPRLSDDGHVSCASCHDVASGGGDGRKTAIGVGGKEGPVNSPTVLNSSLNVAQFWDGRAPTLEAQAAGPLTNASEMGLGMERALAVVLEDPYYAGAFAALFGRPASAEDLLTAIATYERSLVTTGSRFDAWLAGDDSALDARELEGYQLFKSVGCIACHQGQNVGGNMFQKFGILRNYFEDRGNITRVDLGRYNFTGDEADRHVFKVPSLRTAVLTAPYFHDGSAATLGEAVRVMGRYQLGRELEDSEISKIVAFLATLLGEIPDSSAFEAWGRQHEGRES